jgi:plastocyanin
VRHRAHPARRGFLARALSAPLATLAVVLGCGADDKAPLDPSRLAIAKPDSSSGDAQVAVAGTTLPEELRVVVTADGAPAPGVPVLWATGEGSVSPTADTTDENGESTSRWTIKRLYAQQAAGVSLAEGGGSQVVFTAIGTPDPAAINTVLVRGDGANRFDPAEITISVGDTVNWLWPEGSEGHNVVPDDVGGSPPQSGPLRGYPNFHSFRFEVPGVYHYHCAAHGAAGGVGMSGTVTVLDSPGS